MGTWKPGAQRFRDSGLVASLGLEKCCRNSLPWLRLSVAMFALRIISRVSILRGIIIIVLLAVLASAVIALHPQTKEVETVRLVITPITIETQKPPAPCTLCGNCRGDFGRNFGPEAMQSVQIKYKLGAI